MDNNLQGVGSAPGLVERAKAMIVSPRSEWPKVAAEPDDVRNVFMRHVVPLAAIGPIAGLIGGQLFVASSSGPQVKCRRRNWLNFALSMRRISSRDRLSKSILRSTSGCLALFANSMTDS
jgi:hypothetical protein